MVELESLNLERNSLKSLPKSLSQLSKLKTLNLSINYIEEIPKEFGIDLFFFLSLFLSTTKSIPFFSLI